MYQELGLGGGYTFKSDLGRQRAEVSVGTTWEKTLLGTRMLGEYIIGRTMPAPAKGLRASPGQTAPIPGKCPSRSAG